MVLKSILSRHHAESCPVHNSTITMDPRLHEEYGFYPKPVAGFLKISKTRLLNPGLPPYPTPKFHRNQLAMGQVLPHRQIQREVVAAQFLQVVLCRCSQEIIRTTYRWKIPFHYRKLVVAGFILICQRGLGIDN